MRLAVKGLLLGCLAAACTADPELQSREAEPLGAEEYRPFVFADHLASSCPDDVSFVLPEKIALDVTRVPLNPSSPGETRLGDLVFRAGFELRSDAGRFGGLSGIDFLDEDTLLIVSDLGYLFWIDITQTETDDIALAGHAYTAVLRDRDGNPLSGKRNVDAEGLTWTGETALVSFERDHRVLAYDLEACGANARGLLVTPLDRDRMSAAIGNTVGDNKGPEALASSCNTLLIGLETPATDSAALARYDLGSGDHPTFGSGIPLHGLKALTGLDLVGDTDTGTLYSVFRSYDPIQGNAIGLQATDLATGDSRSLAELKRPRTVDNFEGLAAQETESGVRLVIVSDDNYSSRQRTLLMVFDLAVE